jgi:CheY-like chemotaxis protein
MIRSGQPISKIRDFAAKRGDYLISDHAVEKIRNLIFYPKDVYEAVLLEEAEYRRVGKSDAYSPAMGREAEPAEPRVSSAAGQDTVIGKSGSDAAAASEMIGKPRTSSILVVDDDEDTRVLLQRVLCAESYEVTIASDGVEALTHLSKRTFDLILSDVEMPNMDGMKLMEIKAVKGIETPVIFLTALSGVEDELKGFSLGATDYIKKPVTKDILLMRVKNAMRRGL